MKTSLMSATLLLALAMPSFAQSTNGILNLGTSCWNYGNAVPCSNTATMCDPNEKTPAEMLTCRVEYWRKEVERLQAKKADVEKELLKAQERVSAFTDAQKRP